MNDIVNKRPRYFDGQYLQDVDFQTEQNYHIDRQRRFARLLTVSGIAEGLEWLEPKVLPEKLTVDGLKVTVSKGTAIDASGRQIILSQDKNNISLNETTGNQILYIKYQEQESDIQGDSSTRVLESPEIDFVSESNYDPDIHIPLARVVINESGLIDSLDLTVREYSGLYLPTSNVNQPAATLRSVFNEGHPSLAELQGSLSVTGKVGIGGPPGTEHLRVQGNSAIIGSFSVSQATTLGIDGAPGSEQLRVQGNSAIIGSLSVAKATILSGNVGVGGVPGSEQLKVQGNSAITGSLAVAATTTLAGNVAVATTNPKIHLAIGDDDTGLNQEADGELAVYSNNQKRIVIKRDGRVGIGTSSPQSRLSVLGNAAIGSNFANEHSAPTAGLIVEGKLGVGTAVPKSNLSVLGNAAIGFAYANQDAAPDDGLLVQGSVGIGTTRPRNKLDVSGWIAANALRLYNGDSTDQYWEIRPDWRISTDTYSQLKFYYKGKTSQRGFHIGSLETVDTTGTWRNSDLKLKSDIETFDNVLDLTLRLMPKSYHFNYGTKSKTRIYGFLAQDVEGLFPDFVAEIDGIKKLNYDYFSVLAIASIQEQQKIIEELNRKVSQLELGQ